MSEVLRAQQFAFASQLRDGPPSLYRRLIVDGLDQLLSANFPILHATLGDDAWHAMLRAFLATHRAQTPLFTRIGSELVDWLAPQADWRHALAHYEYAGLALSISDDAIPAHDPDGDALDAIPIVSPFAWPLAYAWPVHRIGPGVAIEPDPTFLLLQRDAAGDVHVSTLTPALFRLLELLDANTTDTGRTVAQALAREFDADASDALPLLHALHRDGVLRGTVPR